MQCSRDKSTTMKNWIVKIKDFANSNKDVVICWVLLLLWVQFVVLLHQG